MTGCGADPHRLPALRATGGFLAGEAGGKPGVSGAHKTAAEQRSPVRAEPATSGGNGNAGQQTVKRRAATANAGSNGNAGNGTSTSGGAPSGTGATASANGGLGSLGGANGRRDDERRRWAFERRREMGSGGREWKRRCEWKQRRDE